MQRPVSFSLQRRSNRSLARVGIIHTPHGDIETPAFIVVGTKASVKSVMPEDLSRYVGNSATLANTYHLFLQPGHDVVKDAGGLHAFTGWHMPTMTDSGGFQVFSLGAAFGKGITKFSKEDIPADGGIVSRDLNVYSPAHAEDHGKLCIVDEDGVTFTSHRDGSLHRFTAERSIEIQHALGADIIVAFDECTSPTADRSYQEEAMARTHRWAKRSLLAHKQNLKALSTQGLYGVVQGGRFSDLRRESAQALASMDFDGYGIGGSFSKEDLGDSLRVVNEILPDDKPRHLLGIGEPEDIVQGVLQGCDTFDCVAPTRIGRTGTVYVQTGIRQTTPCGTLTYPELKKINLFNERYKNDHSLLDPLSDGHIAQHYSKAYLAHLFRAQEMLGPHLASIHNLHTIVNFTKVLRTQLYAA